MKKLVVAAAIIAAAATAASAGSMDAPVFTFGFIADVDFVFRVPKITQ